LRTSQKGIFERALFNKISSSTRRIPSESRREAWLADTILLLVSQLDDKAILSGGSAVRNITRVMWTTYDIDFDTEIGSLGVLRKMLRDTNNKLGINRESLGAIYENPERNNPKTFYGERKMIHMLRTTDVGSLKFHIMHVNDLPEMFDKPPHLELVSIEKTDYKVPNGSAHTLFYRKALRANKEKRVEDFLDLYHLLVGLGSTKRSAMVAYVKSKDSKAAVNGLGVLSSDPESFVPELKSRLAYVDTNLSIANMKAKAYTISQELEKIAAEIASD